MENENILRQAQDGPLGQDSADTPQNRASTDAKALADKLADKPAGK